MYRLIIGIGLAIALGACASPGPGAACDPCAQAEATPVGPGAEAAAASATGGQEANQAPFSHDTARLAPQTTIGRGAGATSSESSDSETRHVVSGGAQNCGVILPTSSEASTDGSGLSPAVTEAASTVAAYRAMLQVALMDPTAPPSRVEFLSAQLASAQQALAQAQAAGQASRDIHYHFENSRINQIPFSSSSSDGRPNPETVGPVAEAAQEVGTAVFADEIRVSDPSSTLADPLPPNAAGAPETLPEGAPEGP